MSYQDIFVSSRQIDKVIGGMPFPEYRKMTGLNPSTIVHRKTSALHARHAYESESQSTPAMRFGSAVHAMLFEPGDFQNRYITWSGGDKRGKEWTAFKAIAGDREVLSEDGRFGLSHIMSVWSALRADRGVRMLCDKGVSEVVVRTSECGGRIACKGRIDRVDTSGQRARIVDLKTIANIAHISNDSAKLGYHIKMACYTEWFRRCSRKDVDGAYLMFAETRPPYDVAVKRITDADLEDGWAQAQELIQLIQDDIRSGKYPGVNGGDCICDLELPPWCMMDRQLDFGDGERIDFSDEEDSHHEQ